MSIMSCTSLALNFNGFLGLHCVSYKLILRENKTHCLLFQYEENGKVADSMLVNTILMLVYVTKFFWWEAGYWNTMDIAHDRGLSMIYPFCLLTQI